MSTEILAIACDQQILRSYTLPFTGSVLVRNGQEVEAGQPVAEIQMPERYQVFDAINGLKINPKNIDRHIERLVGEPVKAGDVIAQKSGLISRLFRASQDGMVVAIRDGRITLALGERSCKCWQLSREQWSKSFRNAARWWRWKLAAAGRVGQRAEQLRELTRLEPTESAAR